MTNLTDFDDTVGQIDLEAHTGLILAEDAALKTYLDGIQIPDKTALSTVDVWFRYPEGERRIKYPFITIDFLSINPSTDRWTSYYRWKEDEATFYNIYTGKPDHNGMYIPSTSPELPVHSTDNKGYQIDPYLMHTLMYQVTVHTRSALHDRYLLSRFMTDIFPPRPFWIGVDADHTWRRCELLEMRPADTIETTESGNKRIFRKIYTISMDAEIPQSRLTEIEKVLRVHMDVYRDGSANTEPVGHPYDSVHTIAEPVTIEPPSGS